MPIISLLFNDLNSNEIMKFQASSELTAKNSRGGGYFFAAPSRLACPGWRNYR